LCAASNAFQVDRPHVVSRVVNFKIYARNQKSALSERESTVTTDNIDEDYDLRSVVQSSPWFEILFRRDRPDVGLNKRKKTNLCLFLSD